MQAYYLRSFQQLDTKKRGYLELAQLKSMNNNRLGVIADLADRNDDKKLTLQEIYGYVSHQEAASRCSLSLQMKDSGRGLFELLDSNADSRLSGRELIEAGKRLMIHDKNNDGKVEETEIPYQYRLVISPSTQAYQYVYNRGQSVSRPSSRTGPIWFTRMDRNGDGDVSMREFLGKPSDFKKLDLNGDEYLSEEEATKADERLQSNK